MRRASTASRGLTLIEILVALGVLSMMVMSVWNGFSGTMRGIESTEKIQLRHSIIRNGLSRMASELSMAYLSFNRPLDEGIHYTLFEGRDSFEEDSVSFSAFAHLRLRKDANQSDQCVIQYFLAQDPEDHDRTHLYRRESRRLTGDLPERMEEFFPAYVLIEDVSALDFKYWEQREEEWIDEWATMRTDMHPDRLPERVLIRVGVKDDEDDTLYYTAQTIILMQEKIDLGK
jgi:general secretion pathway protein J